MDTHRTINIAGLILGILWLASQAATPIPVGAQEPAWLDEAVSTLEQELVVKYGEEQRARARRRAVRRLRL